MAHEAKQIDVILRNMSEDFNKDFSIQPTQCKKLIEQGWLPEFNNLPSIQHLKKYFNNPANPAEAIIIKLFLLKMLYKSLKKKSVVSVADIQWVISMRRKLSEQFSAFCDTPNQRVVYRGNSVHTLEQLGERSATTSLPISANTSMKALFALFAIMITKNRLGTSGYPTFDTLYSATLILSTLLIVTLNVIPMINPPAEPNLSSATVQLNKFIHSELLISTDELSALQNSSVIEKARLIRSEIDDLTEKFVDPDFLEACKTFAQTGWEEGFNKIPALHIFKPTQDPIHHYLARAGMFKLISEKYPDPEWTESAQAILAPEKAKLFNAVTLATHPRYIMHGRVDSASAAAIFNIYRYFIHDHFVSREAKLTGLTVAGTSLLYCALVFTQKITPVSLIARTALWGTSDTPSFLQRRELKALMESAEFKGLFEVGHDRVASPADTEEAFVHSSIGRSIITLALGIGSFLVGGITEGVRTRQASLCLGLGLLLASAFYKASDDVQQNMRRQNAEPDRQVARQGM